MRSLGMCPSRCPEPIASVSYAIRFQPGYRLFVPFPPRTVPLLFAGAFLRPRDRDASCGVDENGRRRAGLRVMAACPVET